MIGRGLKKMKTLLLIDTHALIHRFFHIKEFILYDALY